MRSLFLAVLFALVAACLGSNVQVLTPDNFDSVVDGSKNVLVEFFTPWCTHCTNLAPIYEQLGDAYVGSKDVVIASVDAETHRSLGSRFGVTGFPTFAFFPKGDTEPIPYSSSRDLDSFTSFIGEQTGAKKSTPKEHTVALTPENFDAIVNDPSKDVLVWFCSSWSADCEYLVPMYERVAAAFSREPGVVVAKVDVHKHKTLGVRYNIPKFPSFMFFSKSDKSPQDYPGGWDEYHLVYYLNRKASTFRALNGELEEQAGRVTAFDDLIATFFNRHTRNEALEKARQLVETVEYKSARYYVECMEKINSMEESGEDYIAKELARLERILKSAVSQEKQDEFTIRQNILKAFERVRSEL